MGDEPDHLLQSFLANRDAPCPSCNYNLRMLEGYTCPECGDALELRVGLVDPRQASTIAGLIGLACGLGLNGLLLVYAAVRILVFGERHLPLIFVYLNGAGFLVEGLAMVSWLRHWRRIRRSRPRLKLLFVLGCWGLTLANILLFSIFVK